MHSSVWALPDHGRIGDVAGRQQKGRYAGRQPDGRSEKSDDELFGVSANEVEILTITNQDERDHLAAFVPIEQIGTRTYSCAYVLPTTSGGIQVKTANLNWVTCNMIATTLSTSGVKKLPGNRSIPDRGVRNRSADRYYYGV